MIAALEAARSGLFRPEHWARNIVAGVVVGIVALPLAMAFSIASGVKPEQGIYTAIIASLIVSLAGGSRIQIAGPTGAFVVILAGVTAKYGVDGLLLATVMAGVILVLLGVAKFGGVLRFIPDPVILGFTAGIGVIIWVGQWKDFLGLPPVTGTHFHDKLLHLLHALPGLHWATTALAVMSLLVAIFGPRLAWLSRVPGPMLAMTVATVAQAIGQFDGVTTIGTAFGGIPHGLPSLTFPEPSYERVITLIPAAFTIAMLGAIESLLSAVVADGMAGTRHDSNQELIGQGIANIVAPFFGGFAATGAIARTATNIRNGANGPLAGIVHALTLALILVFLAPWVAHVPLCSLAAILFLVAWNMSEARHFVRMVRTAPRPDVVILLVTFSLTVLSDLVIAVNVGVILSMLLFVRRMASSVEVVQVPRVDLAHDMNMDNADDVPADVLVFSIEGPAFFGAVQNLERVLSQTRTDPGAIVIRLNRVPFMDATGLQSLTECIDGFSRRNVPVVLCEARSNVLRKLIRSGLLRRSDKTRRHFRHLRNAFHHLERQRPASRPGA